MSREDWRRSWKAWLRGTAIGFPLGVLPMGGSVIPTFLSYFAEKRLSAHPEEFGHGAIEGVAGPEAANNASTAGVLVPLLTLGVPSSATAAILLAAFQQYGLQPGPLLFSTRPDLVWTLIASLLIGNVMLLVLNLPLASVWARVMLLPRPLLFGGVLVLASLGVYTLNRSLLDVALLYAVGALGLAMRLLDVPLVPAVLGLVLGPMAEQQFRRAVAISEGDLTVFVTRPISGALLAAAVLVLIAPLVDRPLAAQAMTRNALRRRRHRRGQRGLERRLDGARARRAACSCSSARRARCAAGTAATRATCAVRTPRRRTS